MVGARCNLAAAALLVGTSAVVAGDVIKPDDVKVDDELADTEALTGKAGDPKAGRKTFVNKKLGNRLAPHANTEISDQQFHGEIGPPLDDVASRYKPEQLRAIVIDSKSVFGPDTAMPGFYSLKVGKHVRKDLIGETILTAAQVDNMVAYLQTLK
jgi:sulfur-oxidizing protein SoxX